MKAAIFFILLYIAVVIYCLMSTFMETRIVETPKRWDYIYAGLDNVQETYLYLDWSKHYVNAETRRLGLGDYYHGLWR